MVIQDGGQSLQKHESQKNRETESKTSSNCVYYPFILLSSQQASESSKWSPGLATTAEPHVIWQILESFRSEFTANL